MMPNLLSCEGQTLLNLRDRQSWVETLWTCPRAVQDGMASVQAHAVVQRILSLLGALVP